MKTISLLVASATSLLLIGAANAQDFRAGVGTPRTTTETLQAPGSFDLKLRTTGVVPRIIRSGAPLQMINPRARAEYGDGKDLVSKDPASPKPPTGAEGITVFGFNF